MMRREMWLVRHDAYPQPEEFTYNDEEKARASFEKYGFYDPATGWGVTLIHVVTEYEILATTKPDRPMIK